MKLKKSDIGYFVLVKRGRIGIIITMRDPGCEVFFPVSSRFELVEEGQILSIGRHSKDVLSICKDVELFKRKTMSLFE